MKDKIICMLFVIVLTFLLCLDVQAAEPAAGNFSLLYKQGIYTTVYDNYIGYGSDSSGMTIYLKELHMLAIYAGKSDVVWKKQTFEDQAEGDIAEYSASSVQTYPERLYYELDNSILYNFSGVGVRRMGIDFPVGTSADNYMFDYAQFDMVFDTSDEMIQYLEENEDSLIGDNGHIVPDNGGNDAPPTFYLKSYAKWGVLKYVEYTLSWDIDGSFVAENPSEYSFRLYATVKNDATVGALISQPMKEMSVTSTSLPSFYSNGLTFNMNDVKDCINFFQRDSVENHFWLWVQLSDKNGVPLNNNYIRVGVTKGIEITQFDIVDDEGNVQYSYGHWNKDTGQYEYDDGRESNSNGSSMSDYSQSDKDHDGNDKKPMAGLDDYTDESNDFTSSASNVINVLNNSVNSITSVISVFSAVFACLPTWLTDLISVSIGLIVIVGVFKMLKP